VLVDDALFATLDPTVRRSRTADGREFTLTDTVGFVRHLPHQLVEAFRSTLEEVGEADLILHVVDGSEADPGLQLQAVREVFGEVGALDVPELVVVNKADVAEDATIARLRRDEPGCCVVSVRTGEGLEALRERVAGMLPRPDVEMTLLVPFTAGDVVSRIHRYGEVAAVDHTAEGTRLDARLPAWLAGELAPYSLA
jgi:GTP-binding protein HflX